MVTAEGTYRERPSSIAGSVVWQRHVSERQRHARILPDGCIDVIHYEGELLLAGPDTTAHMASGPAGRTYTAIRFGPGIAPGVLGVPADELVDRRMPLSAVWGGARVRRLTELLDESPDPGRHLEAAFAANDNPDEPWVRAVVADVRAGRSIADIATDVGLSERQLHRRGLQRFGYGLKTLARILRLNEALGLARGGMAFGLVAASAGYADQAHLSREVKALAGAPLREIIR